MLMTINIIGCGPTAELWDGKGDSLGVNDCEKTGKRVENLLLIDFPGKFSDERMAIIKATDSIVWTQLSEWSKHFRSINMISPRRWRGELSKSYAQHSSTSPFVAVYLAWMWGYKEIILWGVDMNDNRPYLTEELKNFKELFKCLTDEGLSLWLGTPGSVLPLHVKY